MKLVRGPPEPPPPGGLVWRVHDRTHLELPVPFPRPQADDCARYEWEAYFFVPESFQLDKLTADPRDLEADFKSYVRMTVPETTFAELEPHLAALERRLEGGAEDVSRDLRLFGCRARRVVAEELRRTLAVEGAEDARQAGAELADGLRRLTGTFRAAVAGVLPLPAKDPVAEAARWVDEAISLSVEGALVHLGQRLTDAGRADIVAIAVAEARYRRDRGYAAVAEGALEQREIERLEFRRHTLKRFTSSVLWLAMDRYEPGRWARHALFAVAASFAMAFAVVAARWHNPLAAGEQLSLWLVVAIGAYAVKDRIKASLQEVFSGVLSKRFPHRGWRIRDKSRRRVLGRIDERAGLLRFAEVPDEVLAVRRLTRKHPMEEEARPEAVVWHNKTVEVEGDLDPIFSGLIEIFRVDLRRWLLNTDDPKNRLVFAHPERGSIEAVVAPRVYNVAIVYRLRALDGSGAEPWHRARVVVTRKGIQRIDPIC